MGLILVILVEVVVDSVWRHYEQVGMLVIILIARGYNGLVTILVESRSLHRDKRAHPSQGSSVL